MSEENTVLVLGASGGLGGEMARQLVASGWDVRALRRSVTPTNANIEGVRWIKGDALSAQEVIHGARDCSVIVHAVNPPRYQHWGRLALPMLQSSLAAAKASGATLVFPGNVYNYGPDAFPVACEDSPQHPQTRKGRIRVDLHGALETSSREGCQAIVVTAGDFFGPHAFNNWFARALVNPGQPVRKVLLPGKPGVPHLWAYLPDVARTMIALLERRNELPDFASFHMAGHLDQDGRAMAGSIQRVLQGRGLPRAAVGSFPWRLIGLAGWFMPEPRELLEMRYLWESEARLDNARLRSVLGREPHTPLDEAIEATLMGLGCLQPPDEKASAPQRKSA